MILIKLNIITLNHLKINGNHISILPTIWIINNEMKDHGDTLQLSKHKLHKFHLLYQGNQHPSSQHGRRIVIPLHQQYVKDNLEKTSTISKEEHCRTNFSHNFSHILVTSLSMFHLFSAIMEPICS